MEFKIQFSGRSHRYTEDEKKIVLDVMDNIDPLTQGKYRDRFEGKFKEYTNANYAFTLNNATAGLEIAAQLCQFKDGDELIAPAHTFTASVYPFIKKGANIVWADIDPKTHVIGVNEIKKCLSTKTKAIMPVHYTGAVGNLNEVYKFAQNHNLRVIEDAAHAFGTIYNNKRIGSIGDIACFSFDGIKNITSGEGGCVVTDDQKILEKVKDARLLGVERDTSKRYSGERSWDFNVSNQGWRYHMSNLMAAIGLEQLKRFQVFAEKRQKLAKKYDQLFYNVPDIKPIPRDYETVVPHIYVVSINKMKNRKEIQKFMKNKGIQVGFHYQPNHLLSLYTDNKKPPLPITDKMFPKLLSLPLHPELTEHDVEFISSTLINIIS